MRTRKKIIQVPIDEELLSRLDQLADKVQEPRAAVIREACARFLTSLDEAEADRRYVESYRKFPESSAMGLTGLALAAEVWGSEDWDDAEG